MHKVKRFKADRIEWMILIGPQDFDSLSLTLQSRTQTQGDRVSLDQAIERLSTWLNEDSFLLERQDEVTWSKSQNDSSRWDALR